MDRSLLTKIAGGVAIVIAIGLLAWGISVLFTPQMTVGSPAFVGGIIPVKYTCDGEKKSPPITIRNVPENTRSLVLTVFDLDAPKEGFVHWVVYNMNPLVTDIPEGQLPNGSVEGVNGMNQNNYVPMCPPEGTHRYVFSLYAMSTNFIFQTNPTMEQLKKSMKYKVLAKAEFTAKYGKQ